jgi:HK97 family phage major capsid protein
MGSPAAAAVPMLWGRPVITTVAMQAGFFLVGDFQSSVAVFDRQAPTIEISDSHLDWFARNMLAVRCEERISLAIFQGSGMTYGAF